MNILNMLAIVLDVTIFLVISMDARYMLIKTKETGAKGKVFDGMRVRFIAGNIKHTVQGIKKRN